MTYYERNREKVKAYQLQYREKHREKIRAYNHIWYEANREKVALTNAQHRERRKTQKQLKRIREQTHTAIVSCQRNIVLSFD